MTKTQKETLLAVPLTVLCTALATAFTMALVHGADREKLRTTAKTAEENTEAIREIEKKFSLFEGLVIRLENAVNDLEKER